MADSKRNSVAGKVATPRPSGGAASPAMQPLGDVNESLVKIIGARVRITTAAPHSQTYEGTVFTADPFLSIVAINTRNPPPNPSTNAAAQPGDYHIIPISRIQSYQVLALAPPSEAGDGTFANALPAIGPVDTKMLKQREEARINKLKEDEQDRGKGVSKEGQAIFDALKRINMPVRWHNQEIIAHETVIISAPYRAEDCKGKADKPDVINRVKKVLEGERKKLKEKEERERKAPTPTGPRKGG